MNAINLLRPSRTVVTSLTPRQTSNNLAGDGDWVLNMQVSDTSFACSISNGQVQVYDRERMNLLMQSGAHTSNATTHDMTYSEDGNILFMAQHDGCLAVWDLRQSDTSIMRTPLAAAPLQSLALGFSDTIVATGTASGKIIFADWRQQSTLGSYVNSHRGPITSLCFNGQQLASGADDGLLCYFDTTQPTEESASVSICNVGAGLRKVGFCGDSSRAFALTGSETASLWDLKSGTCMHHYGDLRQLLSLQVGKEVDYLIDAHWEAPTNTLAMAVGSNMGNGAIFHLTNEGRWHARQLFTAGHVGVIRAWHPLSGQSFITAGEDARIVEWTSRITMAPVAKPMVPSSHMVRQADPLSLTDQRPKRLRMSYA
jgi:WD40 repeat protein